MINLFWLGYFNVAPAAKTIRSIPKVAGVAYKFLKGIGDSCVTIIKLPSFLRFSITSEGKFPTEERIMSTQFSIPRICLEIFFINFSLLVITNCCNVPFSYTATLVLVLPTSIQIIIIYQAYKNKDS